MLEKREFDRNEFLWRLFSAVTVVTGFFSLIVFLLLVFNYVQVRNIDPVDNELLTQMRQEYAAMPEEDPALAKRIQDLDLLNRKAYFTSQKHLRIGAILLLVGVVTFLVSFKNAIRWKREKPKLDETPTAEKEFLAFAQSRQLVTWAGVALLGIGLLTSLFTESALKKSTTLAAVSPEDPTAVSTVEGDPPVGETAATIPTWEELEQNWPSFRGPGSNGIAVYDTAPVAWDIETGDGVRWKTTIALPGANSPVVWDQRIFLSGANETTRTVYCFDADSGEALWEKTLDPIPGTAPEPPEVTEETGFAAPTMAAHGDRVFAVFANGDVASLTVEGDVVWSRNLGKLDNHYGHSSSLIAYEGLLFVELDDNESPKLVALDVSNGEPVWSTPRETISWSSPVLAQTEFGPQLILTSEKTVDAYAPDTGKLLWSVECLGGEVAPSAAYSNGIVFAANEFAQASAIRLSGSAEAIETEIIWQYEDFLPEVASPIGDGERFYYGTSIGDLVCLDAETGEELWVEECEDGFYSSPVLVGDRIYILDREGMMYILRAGSEFDLIATIPMGEEISATPAFMDGRIYLRTHEHLYCIEQSNA